MNFRDLAKPVENWAWLDPAGEWLSAQVSALVPSGPLKSALSGTWLGHPLHPLLTDLPIGLFTTATLADLLGGDAGGPVADAMTAAGLLAVVPTAATGLSDWADTVDRERRLGLIHALANLGASTLFVAAVASRRGGARARGRLFGVAGLAILTAGGYLGGHLVFSRGIGVDHTVFDEAPTEWTRVAREADVADDAPQLVRAEGYGVLLYRRSGVVYALADRCTHAGGPLHEGQVDEDLCVTCPWHGSRFRLADGSVVRGPATAPEPSFEAREREGHIEVRLRPG